MPVRSRGFGELTLVLSGFFRPVFLCGFFGCLFCSGFSVVPLCEGNGSVQGYPPGEVRAYLGGELRDLSLVARHGYSVCSDRVFLIVVWLFFGVKTAKKRSVSAIGLN